MDTKKIKVVEAVANVRISTGVMVVDPNGFVRFAIQSQGGGVEVGRKLFVFDHRQATIVAAKAVNPNAEWKERDRLVDALNSAVNQPAKVEVMKKVDAGREFFYVNLYPANGTDPTALLSKTSYTSKHNAGYDIQVENGLWMWTSKSSSRKGLHGELVLVALTDKAHRIIMSSYGYANIGHSDQTLTVIGKDIRQMSEEDLVVDSEP